MAMPMARLGDRPDRIISQEDVARAIEAASAVAVPAGREMLHVIPRTYTVDGQEGIKDPLGMSAVRLEVETHIIAGAATSVQNLSKCIVTSGVQIDEMVISSLAAEEEVPRAKAAPRCTGQCDPPASHRARLGPRSLSRHRSESTGERT